VVQLLAVYGLLLYSCCWQATGALQRFCIVVTTLVYCKR